MKTPPKLTLSQELRSFNKRTQANRERLKRIAFVYLRQLESEVGKAEITFLK